MKQVWLYYAVRFFFDFIVVYPFYTLVFAEYGQDAASIGWLFAIWSFAVVVFEMPLGVVSDRLKRKTMLTYAVICKAFGFCCWLLPSLVPLQPQLAFIFFAAGFVLWGLSIAMASGTDEAWLYETLHAQGRESDYAKIRGQSNIAASLGIASSALLGGSLARFGFTPLIVISICATIFAGICVRFLGTPERTSANDDDDDDDGEAPLLSSIKGVLTEFRAQPVILLLILSSGILFILSGVLDEWDTLYITSAGYAPIIAGIWFTFRLAFESLGYLFAHRIHRPRARSLIFAASISGLLLLGMGLGSSLVFLLPYGIFAMIYATIGVLTETWIQESMDGSRRATILSVKSLMENVFGLLMIVGSGYAAKHFGYSFLWLSGALYALIIGFIIYRIVKCP